MPKITITTAGGKYEFENDSVENVADLVRETAGSLNIDGANLAVNGAPATPQTPLRDGDAVTATKAAGAKGS